MPEAPDLEVFSQNITEQLAGKTVNEIVVHPSKKISLNSQELTKIFAHQKLKEVVRQGKKLHLHFSKGDIVAIHLMLHGALYIFKDNEIPKYTLVEIRFTDDTGLALTDFQKQARLLLNPEPDKGVDALSSKLNTIFLRKTLEGSKSRIKDVLMNQDLISGIGNAYADEILWKARISPFSVAGKIPDEQVATLAKTIKEVLRDAEKQIKKHHPDIINGEVRDFLNVHRPKANETPTGAKIHVKKLGSRKTYYTDEQKLYQ